MTNERALKPHQFRRSVRLVAAMLATIALAAAARAQVQQPPATPPGPLSKAHSSLAGPENCQKCHVAPGKTAASLCLKCHGPIARRIAAKKGVHRDVVDECAACHAEHSGAEDLRPLDPKSFDHAQDAGFPLQGAHSRIAGDCARCHKTRSYLNNKPECASCHTDGHRGALGAACGTCHTPTTWKNASRAFHKVGVFVLEGKHLNVACASCHANGAVKGTPTRCYDCHWIRRQDDRYRTRLGSQCDNCHRPISWTAVRWTHAAATGVALNPQHLTLRCDSCHTSQAFRPGEVQCFACHQSDYQGTQNPNHVSAGFPTTCDACHRPSDTSFRGARFNHNSTFPLVGVHATQPCSTCHKNGVYKGTPRDCYGCHRTDYERAQSPNHIAAGFPTTCDSCHRPTDPSFKGGSFNHASFFALVGVHATQPCSACHKNGVYKGTPRDCYGCHRTDYERAQSPNHIAAGFPTTCDSCHRPSDPAFKGGGVFNHNSVFQLVGVHATQPCTACHKNGVYKGTPRDCYGCHRTDYERAQSPNHIAAGFPTTCDSCHRPTDPSFKGGSFNHAGFFALVGVHATQPCSACHKNNVYRGTPRDCYGCHQADYQRAQNPNHIAAGFPTTCETCHRPTDTSFTQGRFDHTYFPITSGRHAGVACSSCHTDPTNFKVFTCFTCHDRAGTDSKHSGVAGYRYDSQACYTCHPQGRG